VKSWYRWRPGKKPVSEGKKRPTKVKWREEHPVIFCSDPNDCPRPVADLPRNVYALRPKSPPTAPILPPAYNTRGNQRGRRPGGPGKGGKRRFKPFVRKKFGSKRRKNKENAASTAVMTEEEKIEEMLEEVKKMSPGNDEMLKVPVRMKQQPMGNVKKQPMDVVKVEENKNNMERTRLTVRRKMKPTTAGAVTEEATEEAMKEFTFKKEEMPMPKVVETAGKNNMERTRHTVRRKLKPANTESVTGETTEEGMKEFTFNKEEKPVRNKKPMYVAKVEETAEKNNMERTRKTIRRRLKPNAVTEATTEEAMKEFTFTKVDMPNRGRKPPVGFRGRRPSTTTATSTTVLSTRPYVKVDEMGSPFAEEDDETTTVKALDMGKMKGMSLTELQEFMQLKGKGIMKMVRKKVFSNKKTPAEPTSPSPTSWAVTKSYPAVPPGIVDVAMMKEMQKIKEVPKDKSGGIMRIRGKIRESLQR
jgi:hypothetical protein